MSERLPDPNHPRPMMTRATWRDLSGEWEFAFDDRRMGIRGGWHRRREFPRRIQVPFAYQAPLSGIGDPSVHEIVWYGLDFEPTQEERSGDLLLHFGAVDYEATVWVNGHAVGGNRGGSVPFSFNVAPYLREGKNRLVLRVVDGQSPAQPRGKQSVSGKPKGIDYLCTTGVWQRVWLEPVGARRFDSITLVPRLDPDRIEIDVRLHAWAGDYRIEVERLEDGTKTTFDLRGVAAGRLDLSMPEGRRWTPETPTLHGLALRLYEGETPLDEVQTYAGIREVRVEGDRFLLNGEPLFLKMVLDQGYWREGVLTAPDGEALRRDVELTKAMGFNGARKHQKVEDPRWLAHCDRLGLLVWGEMANAREWSFEAEERFAAEWERAVRRDVNHPCIVTWVPINESWGVPGLKRSPTPEYAYLERLVALTRRLDPTRPVIDNDGWEHTDVADLAAIHDYTPTGDGIRARWGTGEFPRRTWGKGRLAHYVGEARYRGQPIVLSESGGFLLLPPEKEIGQMDRLYTVYGTFRTPEELLAKYRDVMRGIADVKVAGFCYTQLTDIEQEINGLLGYDRTPKVPLEAIRAIHEECFG